MMPLKHGIIGFDGSRSVPHDRLEAPESSGDEDEEPELTPEEKAAQVELEELRKKQEEEKEKYLQDVKSGKVIAHSTIQPMSDPESDSDEENGNPLLGEFQAEDLTNKINDAN